MRLLDQVLGHQDIIQKIVESFVSERPGQTYMFVGPAGIGKKMTALGFAQALLCPHDRRACGKCPSCFRLAQGAHEGLKIVAPAGANIKIEQAKEVLEFLSFKSLSGNRVIIIDQAQTLNPQSANALLKTLEEPPAGTFFFLIANSAAGLLPTIRSRSRIVQFKPLTAELLGKRVKAPQWALKAAGGSFEKLAQLQEGPEQEVREIAIKLLKLFLVDRDFLFNEIWRQEVKDRAQTQKIFTYWVGFLKDAIYFQENAKGQIVNLDQPELLKGLADYNRQYLLDFIQESLRAEQAIGAYRDSQLVMEELYIHCRP